MNEFDIIQRFFVRPLTDERVSIGIGDDGAVVNVPAGYELVMSMDTLIQGVHFPASTRPGDIGWKALAVNLSDLAAMGAEPSWTTLSLTLPEADDNWLQAFATGFFELADHHRVSLIGGDLCRGSLSISVQVHGLVPAGQAITRAGARPGDRLYVSGYLGDAGHALTLTADEIAGDYFRSRLDRPQPRIQTGILLRGLASSAIDVSDGLAGDLGQIMRASDCGALVEADQLPISEPLQAAVDKRTAQQLAWTAGDDYELCFTVPADMTGELERRLQAAGKTVHVIGEMTADKELVMNPAVAELDGPAYLHFR